MVESLTSLNKLRYMKLLGNNIKGGQELYNKSNSKYVPAFEKYSRENKAALVWFFCLTYPRKICLALPSQGCSNGSYFLSKSAIGTKCIIISIN